MSAHCVCESEVIPSGIFRSRFSEMCAVIRPTAGRSMPHDNSRDVSMVAGLSRDRWLYTTFVCDFVALPLTSDLGILKFMLVQKIKFHVAQKKFHLGISMIFARRMA